MSTHVTGFAELENALKALKPKVVNKAGNAGVRAGARILLNAMKTSAPSGPTKNGELKGGRPHAKIKRNIKIKRGKSENPDEKVFYAYVSGKAFHALFLEVGTIHMQPRAFAAKAVQNAVNEALNALKAKLSEAVARP